MALKTPISIIDLLYKEFRMKIEVYTDGSATTADKPGGWAYVLIIDGKEFTRQNGGLASATNNVAEITAAIEGLGAAIRLKNNSSSNVDPNANVDPSSDVELISDSQLVLKYATGEYKCKAMHLVPLYIKLRKLYAEAKATTRWVKGHAGDEYNEVCDKLAKAARKNMEA
jgi:ribonuclease HI